MKSLLRKIALLCLVIYASASDLESPMDGMDDDALDRFILGKSFFRTPWVEAPSATTARDGLGPLFSANTCISCHPKNTKGSVYNSKGDIARSLVSRLSINSATQTRYGFMPEPTYGGQLSINAIHGVKYEGKPTRTYTYATILLNGGEEVLLRKPIYGIKDLQYGPLSKDLVISQRVAPSLIGLGLIEAVSDAQILENEDIEDINHDGISGKANRISRTKIGRFNYKANTASIQYQVARAMHDDMGLTTAFFPKENCTKVQKECLESPKGRDTFDVPMRRLEAITFYIKSLKLPHMLVDENGLELFKQLSCSTCHIPFFTKDSHLIYLFSDLLLHDMGNGLADGRVEFQASGSEFKTASLRGISIYKKVLKDRVNFLHDGRAKTLQEAILWHAGEAEESKNKFRKLAPDKRKILIDFLERL